MFKIDQSATFNWTVDLEIPGDRQLVKSSFVAHFKRLPQSRIDAILKADPPPSDEEIVREVLTGWSEMHDEFNAENLDRLLEIPRARMAIAQTYFDAISGSAKRKNSQTPPATGR